MTDTARVHQREVREALHAIVSDPQLGTPALSNPQTMSNLLKDLLPDAPRETSVLVATAEAGLAQILLDHVSQGMDAATAASLAASVFAARPARDAAHPAGYTAAPGPAYGRPAAPPMAGPTVAAPGCGQPTGPGHGFPTGTIATVEPLSQLVGPEVTSCKNGAGPDMRGVTTALSCHTHAQDIGTPRGYAPAGKGER